MIIKEMIIEEMIIKEMIIKEMIIIRIVSEEKKKKFFDNEMSNDRHE